MSSFDIAYCRQCAAENGKPVVDLKPHRTTMALKGLCGNCGFVWMDRDGGCCDADCPIHHPKPNTPETGQHRLARQAAPSRDGERPGDEPVAVGPQAAGRQLTDEDRRRTVYLFFEAAMRGWKDEPANRYADLDWNEIIYRTATSYADAMLKAR